MSLSDCPPTFKIVKLGNIDAERNAINAALQAIVRCLGELQLPDQAGHSGEFLTTDGTSLSWAAGGGGGSVTSVAMTVPTFLSISGSPVTTTGTLAVSLSGTALPIANGGTGATSAAAALTALGAYPATNPNSYTSNAGTVTSVEGSGGTTGLTLTGGPITASGTLTLGGQLNKANMEDGSPRSVLGRSTATGSGVMADIAASSDNQVLQSSALAISFGSIDASTAIVDDASVTAAKLFDGDACSVLGRSANSSGVHADISMSTNDRLLGRVSNVVQSTQLTAGMVPNSLVSDAMIRNSAGFSVIGRGAGTVGAVADITASGGSKFLKTSSGGTALLFEAQAAADLPGGDWIGATSGNVAGSSSVSVAADTTWYSTGASVSLAAGTYLINTYTHVFMRTSAGNGAMTSRIYNVTDASAITNSECLLVGEALVARKDAAGCISMVVTLGSTKTIRTEVSRLAGATYVLTSILSNTSGRTGFSYVRLY